MSVEARELFDATRCASMRKARDLRGFTAGWHGKTPGRILRLALVFEELAWAAKVARPIPLS
jgi:hypothetical protein